jgi:hypothetical protein
MNSDPFPYKTATYVALATLATLFLVTFGSLAGCREFNRYQKRADAKNKVEVTKTMIHNAEQQAKVNRDEG